MSALFIVTYIVGCIASIYVYPARVGLNRFAWAGAFAHPGSRRHGIPWAVKNFCKIFAWPLVFVIWLIQGRPESAVLFGPAAAEKLYGDESRSQPGFITRWSAR